LKELPLSLPGEATSFSHFLLYLRLVRIISNTVRRLYTTTLRRGAVDKIQTLSRELHVWEHTFNQSLGVNRSSSVVDLTFIVPYLQLMSNVAMLMIHQPALTFGPEFPQFKKSLVACTRSCMQIVILLDSNKSERRISYLQPSAARLIFQSALMCLYNTWHDLSANPNEKPTEDQTPFSVPMKQMIDTATGLLELHRSEWATTHRADSSHESSSTLDALNRTIDLLRRLETETTQRTMSRDAHASSVSPTAMPDATRFPQQLGAEVNASDDLWGPSALDGLNQLGMLEYGNEYMFEPLDPYSMDFAVP
jgi:hypothetical protein